MAKENISPNNISSISQDWNNDPANGYPFSGAAVQRFIKSELGAIAKAAYFDPQTYTMYWFDSDESKNAFISNNWLTDNVLFSTTMSFNSEMFRILLTNNNNTTNLNIATNESTVNLSVDFDIQTKSMTDTSWRSVGETGVYVTAAIDVGALGTYETIHESRFYAAGTTYTLNIRDYLAAGVNRVRLQFTSEDDESLTTSLTYTVTMTEMYIEALNNEWYIPIAESGDSANYKLGGFRIVGALSKTLYIDVYSQDTKLMTFSQVIGTTTYDRVPYYYTKSAGLDLSTLTTGIYLVSAYLKAGDVVTSPVNYNIMYIADGDETTAQLVCVNNVSDVVYNYTTSTMFSYAIYNKGSAHGSPEISVKQLTGTTPTEITVPALENVTTNVEHTYDIALEWLTEETLNLSVIATLTYGNEQIATVAVDNSSTFPPTYGYEFYLNPSSRANSESNLRKVVNAVNKREYDVEWTRMAFADGVDGWTTDDLDRKCLYLPAGSYMKLPYTSYRIIDGDGISVEICYRVANVANYNENVITIAENPTSAGFRGIRIKPTNITVHSSADISDTNDLIRGTNVMDEEVIHLIVTIQPNFSGNTGRNLVTGYVNGCKNFQFDYTTGTLWETAGDLIVGSLKSDISLYSLRVYRSVLSESMAQANYINSLKELSARSDLSELFKSVMDAAETSIDYESVKNHGYNFFVIEMLNGATVPSRANGWSKDQKAYCNFEMHHGQHPNWDHRMENLEVGGQGTTSMNYYRWNLRWRIDKSNSDKKVPVSYLSARTTKAGSYNYIWEAPTSSKTVVFDGIGNHPPVKRITAKTNAASSMQSHKIGATYAYTELHNAVGLQNEAQIYASENNLPAPSVAVYQYPAFGFVKNGNEYSFIGLFTIGPDKGDKPTFGFDIDDSELITMEGTDHSRKMVMFNYPWNDDVEYLASNECLNIVKASNDYDNGWEVGNCHGYSTDKSEDQASIGDVLDNEFKPAYLAAYNNSTLIMGIPLGTYGATAAATLEYINSNLESFQSTLDGSGRFTYADYQFWIEGEYVLYYYDIKEKRYIANQNLVTQHGSPTGSTVTEQNEWFKAQRRTAFKSVAENYWDIQDALYHFDFILLFGCMDNFGKNTYPYKMATLAHGGRWKWRQDDLDSMAGIGNAGAENMPTWMEFSDSDNGSVYFGGSTSVFWNLIYECYLDDYVSTSGGTKPGLLSMGKSIMEAMATIAGGNMLNGCMDYIKMRFWDNAQNYFPQSAYNVDATFKYETAWLDNGQEVAPLTQSLGNHYSAEYRWLRQRVIYMMSLFKAGPFGSYADTSLGQIAFRPQSLQSLTVTPYTDLYPAFASGQGMVSTSRVREGDSYTFVGPFGTDGQTSHYINGADLLTSLGDLKNLRLGAQYVNTLSIQGKKLITFKIGDADDTAVTTNVPGLSFSGVPCLETIDARNAESITGVVDISNCPRLRNAYFEGSGITQVRVGDGQKIELLHLPDSITTLSLKNLKFLESENLQLPEDLSNIVLLQLEGCALDSLDTLYEVFSSEGAQLKYISIVMDEQKSVSADYFNFLLAIATGKDKDGEDTEYGGVTSAGAPSSTIPPSIDGTVQVTTPYYQSAFQQLGMTNIEDYTGGLKKALASKLGSLNVIYDPSNQYIEFADDTVKQICATNWGDGIGITEAQAAAVTVALRNNNNFAKFEGNTDITSFDEFRYFTGINSVISGDRNRGAFRNCTNLTSLTIPGHITEFSHYVIHNTTSLETFRFMGTLAQWCEVSNGAGTDINFGFDSQHDFYVEGDKLVVDLTDSTGVTKIGGHAFKRCRSLKSIIVPEGVQTINIGAFYECLNATGTLTLPSSLTSIGSSAFYGCSGLTGTLTLPSSLTSIGSSAFSGCSGLTGTLTLPSSLTSIGDSAFYGCSGLTSITIPDSVTSIGTDAFNACTGLVDLTIPHSVSPLTTSFAGTAGNAMGTLTINGDVNASNFGNFKHIIVNGNINLPSATAIWMVISNIETIRISGNIITGTYTASGSLHSYNATKTLLFLEIMGTITSGTRLWYSIREVPKTFIMHLGYTEGVAATVQTCFANNQGSLTQQNYISKIYVGDGSSQAADQAVLDMYLADDEWAAYADKLDLWYNYDGEYKNS